MYTVIRQGQAQVVAGIQRDADKAFIPLDSANRDYQDFLEWNAAQQSPLNTDNGPALDYLVLKDGGTLLDDGAEVSLAGNGSASKSLTVQYKAANGSDANGAGQTVSLESSEPTPLDKSSDVLGGSGNFAFQVGPTSLKGTYIIYIKSGTIPGRTLRVKFT
jgi:hypothetical protein